MGEFKMTNEQVIRRFLEGRSGQTPTREIPCGYFAYMGNTLSTNGNELINYRTKIAYKAGKKLYINANKYSVTTSKIQSKIRMIAREFYNEDNIVETKVI